MAGTMIQKMRTRGDQENEIYIKRDDLLPFSMGGNKVRIADAFLNDMRKSGCDAMILYGSRHSNLCRVLSNLCFQNSVKCVMICSHEEEEDDEATNNTHLIGWTGTETVHCGKKDIAQTVDRVTEDLRAQGYRPYYIYGDRYGQGNEGTAAMAYAEAYREITAFEREQGWEFDYIFCPSGTGATQSGLICGHLLAGDRAKILGIMISSREKERAFRVISQGVRGYFAKTGQALPENFEDEIVLLDGYRQGGYGVYDDRIRACIRREYCLNGLPLDPIYTAKAYWGMQEYLREERISGKRILFLHTGGTPLFYDFLAKEGTKEEKC